jgi:hypothetical protein
MSTKASVNLYCLIARESPMAVVIRRGPSNRAQLLSWDLSNDHFEKGQWFKGRIYEHHCDLSPSGRYLVYWAGNHKAPYYHWTAVSRPPYLTAISLWPNDGSIGGGVFDDESRLLLTYLSRRKAYGNPLPNGFEVEAWTGDYHAPLGHITEARLLRDGWSQTQQGIFKLDENKIEERRRFDDWFERFQNIEPGSLARSELEAPPALTTFSKGEIRHPLDPIDIRRKQSGTYYLEMRTLGLWQVEGPTHVTEYRVFSATTNNIVLDLGRTDWADWDKNGDLLYARSGCIFRVPSHKIGNGEPLQLIDLTGATFEPLEAPAEFKRW